jgi:catechol 2,3-dioxygenase-like lactoylglutathione lyase family enzyme
MNLGTFSVSLAVEDLSASQAFYEQLGFEAIGGNADQNWLILGNGSAVIGLFQGMFDKNILTFNPGWDGPGQDAPDGWTDVRELSEALSALGLEPMQDTTGDSEAGPASFVLVDPDGNPVLIDQHR